MKTGILYRDFWDVPRIFVVRHRGVQYLFDCTFNESVEDYEEVYRVYELLAMPEDVLNGSWEGISKKAKSYLGEVPVTSVKFDSSKRRSIHAEIIDELRKARRS